MSRKLLWLCILALLIQAGCSTFSSKFFSASGPDRICTGKYCFDPRIVAYKDVLANEAVRANNVFWMSLKVYDTVPAPPDTSQLYTNMEMRRSVADEFKERVLSDIQMDSVVLRIKDGKRQGALSASADEKKFEPRDINYLSFNFGSLELDDSIQVVDFVFHFKRLRDDGNSPDSVVFPMERIERHSRSPLEDLLGNDDLRGI